MAREIVVPPSGKGGIATYQLASGEEFVVTAASFSLTPQGGAGGDNFAWCDMRSPTGHIIVLQPLSPGDGADMFYSLAVDAEPFVAESAPVPTYPQNSDGFGFYYVTQRLTRQRLYAGCTFNVYKTVGSESPPTDPITAVSPDYIIPDLHLWVEDTFVPPPVTRHGGPYLLVGGPNA